jgi:alkylglycerol monooxygenase
MSPLFFAIPVFLLLMGLELWVARSRGLSVYRLKDCLTSLNIGLISEFTKGVGGLISVGMYVLISEHFGAFVWDPLHPLTWLSALVLYDFCYYWVHRTGHEVNLLWASHVVHHSSEEFNLSTALRQSSTAFLFRWIFYVPMAMLGYPVVVFLAVGLIDLLYQYWVHTQLIGKLGWIEKVLVTPSNHRVHHGQNDYCIDKNYGGILCLWDRLFGTYSDERDDEKPVYGIRQPLNSWNPLWANMHHYFEIGRQVQSASDWRHKLMHVFGSPAWSPQKSVSKASFSATPFTRFETATPHHVVRAALGVTAVSTVMLMFFYGFESRWSIAWQLTVVLGFTLLLTLMGAWMMRVRHELPQAP